MDIQGCTSKYGVTSYVTKYITHHGAKSGSPIVEVEKQLDACMTRAADQGHGPRMAYTRWFNSQVAPGVLCQLEVCRVNWGLKRYLRSRKFSELNLKSDLKRVRPQADVSKSLAEGRKVRMVSESVIERYETRTGRNILPPRRAEPAVCQRHVDPRVVGRVGG